MSPFVLTMAMEEDTTNNVMTLKTPNSHTPPQLPQPQPISFSSAVSTTRRHHAPPLVYRECLKNHAAAIGGLAVDGCGEFMPSDAPKTPAADPSAPKSAPIDPAAALKCAACGCHRNFHRRDTDGAGANFAGFHRLAPPMSLSLTPSPGASPPRAAAATPISSAAPRALLALGSLNRRNPVGKKRYRSKFSHAQKEKMRSFAEKLGWKLHKSHEGLVEEFCGEIGVSRGVLKVWMHNNKHRDHQNQSTHHHNGVDKSNGNGNGINHRHDDDNDDDEQNGNGSGSGNNSRGSFDTTDNENQLNEGNSDHLLRVSTNGSSSTS